MLTSDPTQNIYLTVTSCVMDSNFTHICVIVNTHLRVMPTNQIPTRVKTTNIRHESRRQLKMEGA